MRRWTAGRFSIDLGRPRVMAIVNVTPDSFSDGGRGPAAAISHAERLLAEGADILDIGGESTRPGAQAVEAAEQIDRVLPVVEAAVRLGCPVSIDTSSPEVIVAGLAAGADIVNDVRALGRPGATEAVAAHPSCGICLMHMRGEPATMQIDPPRYTDVVAEVGEFLAARAIQAEAAGIDRERIVIDPGIGFGKSIDDNLALLRRQRELLRHGYPLLIGWSRKGTLGRLTGAAIDRRAAASVAAALLAAVHGARILRVHDVSETVDALQVWLAAGAFEEIDRLGNQEAG